jgi:stage II sporulation protein R
MAKRNSCRYYVYIAWALLLAMISWEANVSRAAAVGQAIPQQAIRLRILAHSDSLEDQWIKRKIRDAILEETSRWMAGTQDIGQAREAMRDHLPDIRERVGDMLRKYGFAYGYTVELGAVPFPIKWYGGRLYPAGEYEALRIILGDGKGSNWWCVLFPPLCFTGIVVRDADDEAARLTAGSRVAAEADAETNAATPATHGAAATEGGGNETASQTGAAPANAKLHVGEGEAEQAATAVKNGKEVRFFVWELAKRLFSAIRGALT